MRYYVYVLLSTKDQRFYIGFTTNLKTRLQQHARGDVASTRRRRYLKLLHYEYFINKTDAKAREAFLKSGAGHEQLQHFLKRILDEYVSTLKVSPNDWVGRTYGMAKEAWKNIDTTAELEKMRNEWEEKSEEIKK